MSLTILNFKQKIILQSWAFIIMLFFLVGAESKAKKGYVITLNSAQELNRIIESSGNNLLMIDLYADWCMPCKILSPMLETIAQESQDKVTLYKINIDKNPAVAQAFGVRGIPYVVLIKNKKLVQSFIGVQTKETYIRAINNFTSKKEKSSTFTPDGRLVDGIREIKLSTDISPGKIYVYRGETVKIILEKVMFPYSIHIPEYNITQSATVGQDLRVTFKAQKIGVFPIFCNGKCPSGDGSNFGQIVVMQYAASGSAKFTEVSVDEALALIKKSNPLILDVRTPNEFYQGHIESARLIPLSQLENRLSEIKEYKNKDILVYCRSGNRSTVASEILINNGFNRLYNLSKGIKGWQGKGQKTVKN